MITTKITNSVTEYILLKNNRRNATSRIKDGSLQFLFNGMYISEKEFTRYNPIPIYRKPLLKGDNVNVRENWINDKKSY